MAIQMLLKKIEQKKALLDTHRPLNPTLLKNLDEWFKIELTYTSNAIEGNTLTRSETALVVEKGITIGGKSLREHLEAKNHVFALDYIKTLVGSNKNELSLRNIKEIHTLILKGIDDQHAGIWRTIMVKIAGSTVILPEPLHVPQLMDEFIDWLHQTNDNPALIAFDAHYRLVKIHPFVDGNGRTARLLMNLLLLQSGYPPVVVAPEDRKQYLDSIHALDDQQDPTAYHTFMLSALKKSLDMYLNAIEKSI